MVSEKVIVTGAAGFIGSHTAEALLLRGTSVIAIDNLNDYYDVTIKHENLRILAAAAARSGAKFSFHEGDVSDRASMERIFEKEGKVCAICHLAARAGVRPSLSEPELYIQANIQGTAILLELAVKYKVQNFVYASSSSVYGANTKVPFSETDPVDHPVSPYAATKRACELMASTYHHLYKIPVTGLRFFTVYGPRGRPDMAPFKFVDRISKGLPIERFGTGLSCRDYTYIDDIVSGVISALDHPHPCEVINLGNSQVVSLNEFISVIETCLNKRAKIVQLPEQPGDVPLTYADCAKANKLLGYSPKYDIRRGMQQFVRWYREFYQPKPEATLEAFVGKKPVKMLGEMTPAQSPELSPASSDFELSSEEGD